MPENPKAKRRDPNLAQPEPKRRGIFGRNILWQKNDRETHEWPSGQIRVPKAASRQRCNAKTQSRGILGKDMEAKNCIQNGFNSACLSSVPCSLFSVPWSVVSSPVVSSAPGWGFGSRVSDFISRLHLSACFCRGVPSKLQQVNHSY